MKEFKKWFNKKRSPEEILRLQACITPENLTDIIAETAWQAALEWAMTQDTDLNATELANAIEKELDG